MEDYPRNLKEFDARFRSEEACREYLLQLRWPDGFRCPRCGCRESSPVRAVLLRCRDCRHQTSVTAGTIFQDTRTSLRLWFQAMVGGQSEERRQRVGAATSAGSEEL
jgi:Transposase zinc-ribbon domain